jgi:hypothetical protein
MESVSDQDARALKKTIDRHNLIIIALLCSTTLAPAAIFFVRGPGEWLWLIIFIGLSYLISLIPKPFYDKLQWSRHVLFYEKLGVHVFKRLATNGDYINRRIRRKFPRHRQVSNVASVRDKWQETYTTERSHTVLFVFCLLTSVYAWFIGDLMTGWFLFFGNIIFNLYPNLLQQYNRLRYKRVMLRSV